jgi:hypothetical protein
MLHKLILATTGLMVLAAMVELLLFFALRGSRRSAFSDHAVQHSMDQYLHGLSGPRVVGFATHSNPGRFLGGWATLRRSTRLRRSMRVAAR